MEEPMVKKVPLEEALSHAGRGLYSYYVIAVSGVICFAGVLGMQAMSMVVPAAGCDLRLTSVEKGTLNSIAFTGSMLSSYMMGVIADISGRKKTIMFLNISSIFLFLLSSVAPNPTVLIVVVFAQGFVLGGVFTTSYVYVSEFCSAEIRTTALLIVTAIGTLANLYLPSSAWLILQQGWELVLPGGHVFTTWRIYVASLCLPGVLAAVLLHGLPETPKFLLNAGKEAETLAVLRSLYSVNQKVSPLQYPIESLVLDTVDSSAQMDKHEDSSRIVYYLKTISKQCTSLFKKEFLPYTLVSAFLVFSNVTSYNTIALWLPEQVRQLMEYSKISADNATLCDVMALVPPNEESTGDCQVNYNAFVPSVVIGCLQSVFFLILGLVAHRMRRKSLIVVMAVIAAGSCTLLLFANTLILTLLCLGTITIILPTMFSVIISVVVDYFPTSLRSTATATMLLMGRAGAAGGIQLVGALVHQYCIEVYSSIVVILIGIILCGSFLPAVRK